MDFSLEGYFEERWRYVKVNRLLLYGAFRISAKHHFSRKLRFVANTGQIADSSKDPTVF